MLTRSEKRLINHEKLQELVNQLDPRQSLDPEVEDILLELADEFLDDIIDKGCLIAKNRGSTSLEVSDLQLHLEHNWGITIPGHSRSIPSEGLKENVKDLDEHKNRLRLVQNHNMKFIRRKKKMQQQKEKKDKDGDVIMEDKK